MKFWVSWGPLQKKVYQNLHIDWVAFQHPPWPCEKGT